MEKKLITLKDLAQELGLDRSNMRKIVLGMGIEPGKVRSEDSRRQQTLAITREEADRVRSARSEAGFAPKNTLAEVRTANTGYFYLAVLDAEARPNRIKVGYTDNLDSRLDAYRTGNPEVSILRTWNCKRVWEPAAIAAVTNYEGCVQVAGEVFDCGDSDEMVSRGDKFFVLLN